VGKCGGSNRLFVRGGFMFFGQGGTALFATTAVLAGRASSVVARQAGQPRQAFLSVAALRFAV
jgi:hypothetical protein